MKRIITLLIFCVSTVFCSENFKKINENGEANFIFATQAIPKGKESSIESSIKSEFKKGESIYARGYFPKMLSQIEPVGKEDVKVYVEMWINGKKKFRGDYDDIPGSWDQMSLYMSNTGDDDFKGRFNEELNSLSDGAHRVLIYFLQTYVPSDKKTIQVYNDYGQLETRKNTKVLYMTKGEFQYLVGITETQKNNTPDQESTDSQNNKSKKKRLGKIKKILK